MYGSLVAQFARATKDCSDFPIPMTTDRKLFLRNMLKDEIQELFDAKSILDEQDALIDMIYYIVDQCVYHGVNPDPIFAQVHRANMDKRLPDGTFLQRDDGKVLKPEGWKPRDKEINDILFDQIENNAFAYGTGFQDHLYMASPYSHEDSSVMDERFDAACEAYVALLSEGHIVFAPIPFCHSVARLFDLHTNFTFWQLQDLYFVRTCRAFVALMLPGWKESVGLQAELTHAQYWGKQILYINPEIALNELYLDEECTRHAEEI